MHLELVSPEGAVLSADVDSVCVPSAEGNFGALARMSPLMAIIAEGQDENKSVALEVMQDGVISHYHIEGGFVDVTPSGVSILAEKITIQK